MAQEIKVGVRGMTCAACVARVERALKRAEGVEEARMLDEGAPPPPPEEPRKG
jgi:cation transport ATPase